MAKVGHDEDDLPDFVKMEGVVNRVKGKNPKKWKPVFVQIRGDMLTQYKVRVERGV
jgi:hypothetical protein